MGTAVAGGVALNIFTKRGNDDWSDNSRQVSSTPLPTSHAIQDREYDTDYFILGVGYYQAPYFGWFPYRYNFFDPSRGYYHGGLWTPERDASSLTHSRPTPQQLAKARSEYDRFHNPTGGSGYVSSGVHYLPTPIYYGGSSFHESAGNDSFHSSNVAGSSNELSHGGFGSTGESVAS